MAAWFRYIPSLLTIGNLVLGFIAMVLTYDHYFSTAALMVLIGMVVDAFDGRIARWLRAESSFGRELDSLADICTFGIAPSFLMYVSVLQGTGFIGALAAILFPVFGAIRLARYNVQTSSSRYFVGLPITASGGILATLALYRGQISPTEFIMPACMFVLCALMVSKVRYPNFKKVGFPRSAAVGVPSLALFFYLAFRFNRGLANRFVLLPLAVYALYGAFRTLRRRSIMQRGLREAEQKTELS